MHIQTTSSIKRPVQAHFRKYPRASIYTSFKKYRHQERYSSIADFPLICAIVLAVAEIGIKPNIFSIKRIFSGSPDLKGQKIMCALLIKDAMRAFYKANSSSKEGKKFS